MHINIKSFSKEISFTQHFPNLFFHGDKKKKTKHMHLLRSLRTLSSCEVHIGKS